MEVFYCGRCTTCRCTRAEAPKLQQVHYQLATSRSNKRDAFASLVPDLLTNCLFREMCDMTVERYSFFEAQKGKTSLDSHFATFKFVLKGWIKRGFDLVRSENIVEGTKDHLKGTNVYEIHIDRTKEPRSAKTLDGISSYSDFSYKNDRNIEARELTDTGATLTLSRHKIEKL